KRSTTLASPRRSRTRSSGARRRTFSEPRISCALVAAAGPFTTREQLANARIEAPFVRESWTLGACGAPMRWRDTRADLARRAALWREALQSGGVAAGERVMLALPPRWAVGADCLLAVLEMDVLTTLVDDPLSAPSFEATTLVATPTDALR